jgi:stage III sporulation protein AG
MIKGDPQWWISFSFGVQENTIYSTEGSDSVPYVVMRMLPRVEGVLVVAEGAGNGTVNKSVTEMIQALFDVEVHKIKVVKMAASN